MISSRSLARVRPRRRCATRRRDGFAGVDRRASFVEEFHVLGGLGFWRDTRLEDTRRKTGGLGWNFAPGKRGFIFGFGTQGVALGCRISPRWGGLQDPQSPIHNPQSTIHNHSNLAEEIPAFVPGLEAAGG